MLIGCPRSKVPRLGSTTRAPSDPTAHQVGRRVAGDLAGTADHSRPAASPTGPSGAAEGAVAPRGQHQQRPARPPDHQVREGVAGVVDAADQPVDVGDVAWSPGCGRRSCRHPARCRSQSRPSLVATPQVGVTVAGDVPGTHELLVARAAGCPARRGGSRPSRVRRKLTRPPFDAGDEVREAVAVEVARRGDEVVSAEAARLPGHRAEAVGGRAGTDLQAPGVVEGDQVALVVPREVGGGQRAAGGPADPGPRPPGRGSRSARRSAAPCRVRPRRGVRPGRGRASRPGRSRPAAA